MEKLLFLLLFVSPVLLYDQINVDGVDINKLPIKYCQIVATGKAFSNKVTINIDHGQKTKWIKGKGSVIKDFAGKPVVFNSTMDA